MKKILAFLLVVIVLLGMVGCNSNRLKGESSKFIVPKKAVTTMRVVINPAFNLYLDAEDNVVAMESLNEDAKTIEAELDIIDETFIDAVVTIVKVSKENGFVNNGNKDFTIKLVETKESGKENLLDDAIEKVNDALTEENIEIEAKVDDTVFVPTGAYSIIKTLPSPYDTSAEGTRTYACLKIDFDICNYWGIMLVQMDTPIEDWTYIIYNGKNYSTVNIYNGGWGKITAEDNVYTLENEYTGEQIKMKANWDGTLTVLKNELLFLEGVPGQVLAEVEKGDVLVPHVEYGERTHDFEITIQED